MDYTDGLEGAKTIIEFMDSSGTKGTKQFKYRQPFGIYFRYIQQVYDQNNWIHAPNFLERTWATNLWPVCNVAWYIAVSEVKIALESGYFQNYGVVKPSIYLWRSLEIKGLENTTVVKLGDKVRPRIACRILVYIPCEKITVKHYGRMRYPSKKKRKKVKQKYQN